VAEPKQVRRRLAARPGAKRASDFAAEDHALSVREELHHHIVDLDAARRQAVLFRDQLIPLTQQTLTSAQPPGSTTSGPSRTSSTRTACSWRTSSPGPCPHRPEHDARPDLLLTGSRDVETLVALAGEPPPDHDGQIPDESK
jgi:hypothetical protein